VFDALPFLLPWLVGTRCEIHMWVSFGITTLQIVTSSLQNLPGTTLKMFTQSTNEGGDSYSVQDKEKKSSQSTGNPGNGNLENEAHPAGRMQLVW
jgi:hypothetical protein